MLQIVGDDVPLDADHDYWSAKLPMRVLERLLDGHELVGRFDALLIDEAQDLCTEEYLDVLDLLVKGGLKDGVVHVFGDFEFQDIFLDRDERDGRRDVFKSRINPFSFALRDNCRNRPQIGSVATAVYETSPYRHYRRPDDGVKPTLIVYPDHSSQDEKLAHAISALRDERYQLGDITILSRLNEGAAWRRLDQPYSDWLTPAKNLKAAKIRTSTIHAFKGMESAAVIVCDIDLLSTPEARDLLYVAASRATDRLILLLQESAKQDLLTMIVGDNP